MVLGRTGKTKRMLVSLAVFHLVTDGQGFLGNALFKKQWVQGMMAWQGVNGTQKQKIPGKGNAQEPLGQEPGSWKEETSSTNTPSHPRAFAYASPSV